MSSRRLVQNNGGGWSRFGEYDQVNESKLMRSKGTWTRVTHQNIERCYQNQSFQNTVMTLKSVCVCVTSRVIFSSGINKRNYEL